MRWRWLLLLMPLASGCASFSCELLYNQQVAINRFINEPSYARNSIRYPVQYTLLVGGEVQVDEPLDEPSLLALYHPLPSLNGHHRLFAVPVKMGGLIELYVRPVDLAVIDVYTLDPGICGLELTAYRHYR